jgi:hypothetical protein
MSNNHMTHLEDLLVTEGSAGARRALKYCGELLEMMDDSESHLWDLYNLALKWDGAPAIICGRDPKTDRFFIATKHKALANEQVLAYSIEDIKAQYADKGDLVEVLTQVFIHLENLPWFTIMQGDVLWVDQTSRKPKWQTIEQTEFMTFKPNTLTYGVPGQSLDALLWTNKRVGVVFHTRYDGGVFINQMDTGFNVASQVYELQREAIGIHIQDALFEVDVRLMRGERQTIQALLKDSEARITPLLDTIASETHVTSPGYLWKLYVNSLIREDRLADYGHDVREFVWNRLSAHFNSLSSISARENWINRTATTMNWLRDNAQDWRKFVELYQNIMVMKDVLVGALNARGMDVRAFYTDADSGHLFETDHEGFVLIEKGVGAVKLVDRMNFSRRNMLSRKGWQG